MLLTKCECMPVSSESLGTHAGTAGVISDSLDASGVNVFRTSFSRTLFSFDMILREVMTG